jgi:hypothetical protein
MSTIEMAWDAFTRAIEEAREVHARGDDPIDLANLIRHARELLDIIEEEIAANPIAIPGAAGAVLAHLRGRLEALERDVMPAKH